LSLPNASYRLLFRLTQPPPNSPEKTPPAPGKPADAPKAPQKKKSSSLFPLIALLALLPLFLVFSALFLPGPLEKPQTVIIPRGTTVHDIATSLASNGVISNPFVFRAAARILAGDSLQAGEYLFPPQQSISDIVLMLRDGHAVVRMFTVAEGLTSFEIVSLMRNDPALTPEVTAIPAEGSLLPETYRYNYGDSHMSLIERMQKGQRDLLNELWANRDMSIPLKTPQEAVIMASVIEKETSRNDERARIAGVFYNRQRQGMRLQSDPTVIYALTKGQSTLPRELTHDDLAIASPFNTYVHDGLPPKPICNPGRASLEAALHPEKNDYLYFVADGKGGHAFAKDITQHNKNITHWLSLSKP